MAKKKNITSIAVPYEQPRVYDNNPDGPSDLPNHSLNGCYYPKGKIIFCDMVAAGEAADRPDVIVQTADGVARSQGQNKGQQGNYAPDSSWAEDKEWKGANLTGM